MSTGAQRRRRPADVPFARVSGASGGSRGPSGPPGPCSRLGTAGTVRTVPAAGSLVGGAYPWVGPRGRWWARWRARWRRLLRAVGMRAAHKPGYVVQPTLSPHSTPNYSSPHQRFSFASWPAAPRWSGPCPPSPAVAGTRAGWARGWGVAVQRERQRLTLARMVWDILLRICDGGEFASVVKLCDVRGAMCAVAPEPG